MNRIDIVTNGWSDYALLDTGNGRKLEKFGVLVLDRPDPQILWGKTDPTLWIDADAQFLWADTDERWSTKTGTNHSWMLGWKTMRLTLSLKGFKHVGVFPEHVHQWEQLQALGAKHTGLTMLNLFGYTGAASIAAALAGIAVTHVDASKSTIALVKENAQHSGLASDAVRIVCEDALRYVKRLVARGEHFDIVIMDPPAFGRGPKGEVWKIEESLVELIALIPALLSSETKLVILNGYASGYSARTYGELLSGILAPHNISYGDVGITQTDSDRILTTGIYAAWKPL